MIPRHLLTFLTLVLPIGFLWAQQPTPADTLPPRATGLDTLGQDTLAINWGKVRLSKDSLDEVVDYKAVDSMISDFINQRIYLYGDAEVKYTTITLKADYIELDYRTNIVTASGLPDSTGRKAGNPEFSDGSQTFQADSMRYNFDTGKGIVYQITTKYNDIILKGGRAKFVSGKDTIPAEPGDTTRTKSGGVVYEEDGFFTTCTADHPHFGIRSSRQKVIPDKMVIVGSSNLEIMGVPTPLWLPFGFFPLSKGRRTGLIFPRDYEYSPQWGFGLRDIGWFFPLGDHFNLTLTGNIYVKGTWGINAYSQYRKRYKYNGSLRLGFDVRRQENNEGAIDRQRSFGISWTHNQDQSAHPTINFGGSINMQTNSYRSRVFNDPVNVLPTQLNSNFRFEKRWLDKPFNFGASFNHSQNTATGQVTINFPTLNFQTQALYPFKRQGRGSNRESWYETIVFRYRGEARNTFATNEDDLFTGRMFENTQFGVQHTMSTGLSFKVLKYFNLNPSVDYEETWYTKATRLAFNPMPVIEFDTIRNPNNPNQFELVPDTLALGSIDTFNLYGFKTFREYGASISMNTQIFGTLQFKKGWIRGLRHVIKPSVSFGYRPDYLNPRLGYFDSIPVNVSNPETLRLYSLFNQGIFGSPPQSGRQMALSYSINNIFEAKVFSAKDSTVNKVRLLDNLVINGSYNFAADSLKWSPITLSATTRFFKGATTFLFGATFDPYVTDNRGLRINRSAWRDRGQIVRFDRANAAFNTNLTIGKIRALFQNKEEEVVEDIRQNGNPNQPGFNNDPNAPNNGSPFGAPQRSRNNLADGTEDFLSLLENFSISHNLLMSWQTGNPNQKSFEITTNSVNLVGNIQLSKYWGITLSSIGYDLVRKDFTYPAVGFTRDLHCWEMSMFWAPTRGTYSFSIRVKPGTLDFIKIPWEQNNADGIRAFQ